MNSHDGEPAMQTIGLIGGMSWESTAEYYRIINQETKRRLGGHHNAKSVLVTVDFADIDRYQVVDDWDSLRDMMVNASKQLDAARADFIVICANTMHKVAPAVESTVTIPVLHIADVTAAAIQARGFRKVGLLGTRFTMAEDFYRGRLLERFGIEVLVPEPPARAEIHRVILDELCHGNVTDKSRRFYQDAIRELGSRGAQGIILGCTEIPMLVKPEHSDLPLFDTTTLHAEAAVEKALAGIHVETAAR
jgi:aspartate racemase